MTKREICESNQSIAYYSGFNGFEVKWIESGIEDFMYAISNVVVPKSIPTILPIFLSPLRFFIYRYTSIS